MECDDVTQINRHSLLWVNAGMLTSQLFIYVSVFVIAIEGGLFSKQITLNVDADLSKLTAAFDFMTIGLLLAEK